MTSRGLVVTTASLVALAVTAGVALAAEPGEPVRQAAPPPSVDELGDWADAVSDATGVPERVLFAYGAADLELRDSQPDCGLTWNTLAGIGSVESNHARFGGADLDDGGRATPEIIGLPLDGRPGVKLIADTDGGALDGDTEFDRAVGPMQFIPETWARFGADADGDGTEDPHDIDDAALGAGRYLCAGDRTVATGDGWWAALLSYNRSTAYGQRVHDIAGELAEESGS